MTLVTTSSGYTYKTYPVPTTKVVAHTLQTSDGGVHIDSTNNNLDSAHLVLSGDLPTSEYFIRCHDFSQDVFSIDGSGDIECTDIRADKLHLPQVEDIETYLSAQQTVILANQSSVTNATRLKGAETLVKRGQSQGTEIEYVKANQVRLLQMRISVCTETVLSIGLQQMRMEPHNQTHFIDGVETQLNSGTIQALETASR